MEQQQQQEQQQQEQQQQEQQQHEEQQREQEREQQREQEREQQPGRGVGVECPETALESLGRDARDGCRPGRGRGAGEIRG